MKRIIIVLLTFLLLANCGYEPIYSSKQIDFKFNTIIADKNDQLNSKVKKRLKNFTNAKSERVISLKINTQKKINILSKDKKGDPSRYEMNIKIDLVILDNQNENLVQSFEEKFNYKTSTNKFELSQYEKEIEDILINKSVENIIVYLSKISK